MEATTYTLGELAGTAGVSARTVRYYISEGLLPPPEGHGAATRYTAAHLERLRRIAELKARYLPLREIRARLGDPEPPTPEPPRSSRSDARDYLRTLRRSAAPSYALHEEDAGVAYSMPPPATAPLGAPPAAAPAFDRPGDVPGDVRPWEEDLDGRLDERALAADELTEDLGPPGRTWRRISLGPDAELVVAEDLVRRRRDKVAWLVRWARRVLR